MAKSLYETLGISENASADEIKKAYRKLVREYHPDIIKSQNKGEEYLKEATRKTQEINEAYDRMIKHFDSSPVNSSYAMQPSLEERIALVQEAYDTLSNDKKRSAYDQSINTEVTKITPNSAQAAGRQMKLSLHRNKQSNQKSTRLNVYQDYSDFRKNHST